MSCSWISQKRCRILKRLKYSICPNCVKSVRIRSYSGPHFPAFGMNTERYSVSLCIHFECGKRQTRITPNTDTFHAEYFKDYLSYRKQKIKVNKTFSNWKYILHGVLQGSILGALLFHVFHSDLSPFTPYSDFVNYANDNTPFTIGSLELEVINEITSWSETLSSWSQNNCMELNTDKLHLLLCNRNIYQVDICMNVRELIFVMRNSQVHAMKNFCKKH